MARIAELTINIYMFVIIAWVISHIITLVWQKIELDKYGEVRPSKKHTYIALFASIWLSLFIVITKDVVFIGWIGYTLYLIGCVMLLIYVYAHAYAAELLKISQRKLQKREEDVASLIEQLTTLLEQNKRLLTIVNKKEVTVADMPTEPKAEVSN